MVSLVLRRSLSQLQLFITPAALQLLSLELLQAALPQQLAMAAAAVVRLRLSAVKVVVQRLLSAERVAE